MERYTADVIPYEQVELTNTQWIRDQEQLFIQLMVDIVIRKGNKSKGSILFAKDGWLEMCKKLYHRTGKKHDPK